MNFLIMALLVLLPVCFCSYPYPYGPYRPRPPYRRTFTQGRGSGSGISSGSAEEGTVRTRGDTRQTRHGSRSSAEGVSKGLGVQSSSIANSEFEGSRRVVRPFLDAIPVELVLEDADVFPFEDFVPLEDTVILVPDGQNRVIKLPGLGRASSTGIVTGSYSGGKMETTEDNDGSSAQFMLSSA